ncbi:NnrS family protein [Paracoccus sp. PAR01]|uniref:NnrS family protein n=1 Tax=Paracoccus sp. PAR01 TaxID=2769282 RepID=UPI00177D3D65|nr:NnrS family protein [Paracoccus sp. PAR01]MBD9527256.1 NnrS family protein [Paracoccus sp. PAR01]
MAGTAERMRDYRGPAIFSHGFRSFFLLSAIWAAGAMILWILMLTGAEPLASAFDPFSWHAHEFLFGYLAAVIGGFVLTAVPNWTGRLPVMGWPLVGLVGLWLAGRLAVACSSHLPWQVTALIDLSLYVALVGFLAREIIRGKNWRNLPVVGLIALYGVANLIFHIEAARDGTAFEGLGMRLGLGTTLMLIALIGGRIIPSFTRNWLAARGSAQLPQPFGRADAIVLGLTALVLLGFVGFPDAAVTRWLMLIAGAAHLWRMSRWCSGQIRSEPLLWVLHLAYALLALGFVAEGAAGFDLLPLPAARHVWLAGAIGLMTLGVMTRATLGHTGRMLHAGPATVAIYLALFGSVVMRLLAGIFGNPTGLLHLSGGLWIMAFAGYALVYGPMLLQPRLAKKPVSGAKT